ncbi:glucose-6-phosphate 1-dehydrogenase, chloroplastic [Selaginella moellendorffii]|uniref:glucose-6-phosphate 1-dehydrogenase, chloroplastic n=1 Tax=Selaginella moellendorffii TaxID=88036 RepID=UPI000D1C75AC|nr:glucose-6-phosphate 1-dehydrogenase, chloroplastic [Selaginella moellendorffii]|eukprot:XP_024545825.1 glucose-6-phosphate 1-dehydrogenase, chloroplastic [Selaginella moellendorffii]
MRVTRSSSQARAAISSHREAMATAAIGMPAIKAPKMVSFAGAEHHRAGLSTQLRSTAMISRRAKSVRSSFILCGSVFKHATNLFDCLKLWFMCTLKILATDHGIRCSSTDIDVSAPPKDQDQTLTEQPVASSSGAELFKDQKEGESSVSAATTSLSIIVLGATGDLAKNKIFPALFALYYTGYLPEKIAIFGYSRSELQDEDLRRLIMGNLTCRLDHREGCEEKMESFLKNVYYEHGGYDTCDGMVILDKRLKKLEGSCCANRIFYLSVPHEVVVEVAQCVGTNAQSRSGHTRIIIEKPFGNDVHTSKKMTEGLLSKFTEDQIYRIDHLLGRDLIENLTVLRFSNLIFEPLWNRTYIRNIQILFAEDWGVEGRGRYFDEQGIIRDIVQSHLFQTIGLLAMEPPVSLEGEDIRNEKVKVLRSMRKPALDDVVLGQYKESVSKGGSSRVPGYLSEQDVPADSLTPTFIASVLYIDNGRWDGVPFLIKAGHGLIKHKQEIRIQFRGVPGNLYRDKFGFNIDLATNELVLRVHPDEAINLKINNKVPGLGLQLDSSELNLLYRDKYNTEIPDSYERLILDVIDGDSHLFIRSDELAQTWEIISPLLEEIETHKVAPELYTFGGRGPVGAYYLGAKHGVKWADD